MFRILLFFFLLFLCYTPMQAQYVGQSRTYIIKQFSTCKITKNISDHLQFDCDGLEVLCYLDESDLCIFQGMEVLTSDWNNLQVSLVWNNASCATKDKVPTLSSTVSGLMQEVMVYKQREKTFYFFDCDFQGNQGEKKSWAYYKT